MKKQHPLVEFAATFGFGYFFGLGALALTHLFVSWPDTSGTAAWLALLSGAGAVGTRLYNRRVVRPSDDA